jgi:hypothetical protein
MPNFTRSLQRANMLDAMNDKLKAAELAESRAVFYVAMYEAVNEALSEDFVNEVRDLIKDTQPKTKGEFYQIVYSAAKTVIVEREFAATQPVEPAPSIADTLSSAVADVAPTQPPASDSSDTSPTEPTL